MMHQVRLIVDYVLTEHGGLLHVLLLAVHLRFFGWTTRGDHSEPLVFLWDPSFMPNRVGGLVVVANEILVSAQGPLVLGFWLWGFGVWGLGLTIARTDGPWKLLSAQSGLDIPQL